MEETCAKCTGVVHQHLGNDGLSTPGDTKSEETVLTLVFQEEFLSFSSPQAGSGLSGCSRESASTCQTEMETQVPAAWHHLVLPV